MKSVEVPAEDVLAEAPASNVVPMLPRGFYVKEGGIWCEREPDANGNDRPPIFVASEFEIIAETRGGDGNNWGKLIRWKDRDGRQHEWAMPATMLAGDGIDYRRELLNGGLVIGETKPAREKLSLLLQAVRRKERATAVSRVGWHEQGFVFPDETIVKG